MIFDTSMFIAFHKSECLVKSIPKPTLIFQPTKTKKGVKIEFKYARYYPECNN